jgi:hypothetical protein
MRCAAALILLSLTGTHSRHSPAPILTKTQQPPWCLRPRNQALELQVCLIMAGDEDVDMCGFTMRI